jgi:hypothetical protein
MVDPDRHYITEDDIQGHRLELLEHLDPPNVEGLHVPLLIMAMTGHYWMVPGEIFFHRAASPDKQLVFVEGASHSLPTCKPCEEFPGQYGDTFKTTFDYVAEWLRERFVAS